MKLKFVLLFLSASLLVAGCSTDRRCRTGQAYETSSIDQPLSAPTGMQVPPNDQVLKIPDASEDGLAFSYQKPGEEKDGEPVTYCLDLPPKIPAEYR